MTTEQTVTEAKPNEPAKAAPPRASRQRTPLLLRHHPSLAVGALLLVIGELVAYRLLGVLWWAVGNAALAVLVFGAGLAWRRKGKPTGGLLDRLLPSGRRGTGSPTGRRSASAGPGRTLGGGRPQGLFGRSSVPGRSGGGAGGGRGLLGRLTGTGRGRTGSGAASGSGGRGGASPATGSGRGLLGRLRAGRQAKINSAGPGGTSRQTARGGGQSAGRASRLRRMFTGERSGRGSQAGGRSAGGSTRGGGRSQLPRFLGGATARRANSGTSGGRGTKAGGGSKPSRWNPLNWKSWRPGDVGKSPTSNATSAKPNTSQTKPAGPQSKPNPGATEPRKAPQQAGSDATEQTGRPTPRPQPAPPVPVPNAGRTALERSSTVTIRHDDDASLQRWGRNLAHIGPALDEIAKGHDKHIEEGKLATTALKKMANAADTELPASKVLVADLQGIADESARIDAEMEALAARRRQLISRGEALSVTYKREHAMDEDRLNSPRTSRAAEKRADVTRAEQDT